MDLRSHLCCDDRHNHSHAQAKPRVEAGRRLDSTVIGDIGSTQVRKELSRSSDTACLGET